MENNIFKCSFIEHKEIDAIKFCQECNVYLCNKCDKFHSGLLNNHHVYLLNQNEKEIFTGLCKTENHSLTLDYFCKTHNELCCSHCITKIKGKGRGQHTDCIVCNIEDIVEEKEKSLDNNIKSLESLIEVFQSSIKEINKIFDEINENKEEIKLNIQKTFTKIRNELNNREDELLDEVDRHFQKNYFGEDLDILKEKDKLPNKIKFYLEKGKTAKNQWNNNKNKTSLINDCINIEKMLNNINQINQNMNKYKCNDKIIKFFSDTGNILRIINKFGSIDSYGNIINRQEVNVNIDDFDCNKIKNINKINDNCGRGNSYVYDEICFFISKENEYVLGYIDANSDGKSIIFYDINNDKEIKKINNAHNKCIHSIKYYNYSLYDIILSTSYDDDIKLWNYNKCVNTLTISRVFNESSNGVYSACIAFDENISHILCVGQYNYIKVFNAKGNLYKNIGTNDEYRRYIDLCELNNKRYIISGGTKGITVFNYPDLNEYHRFVENNDSNYHNYAKIIKINEIYNLIDVGNFQMIKIWNFENKALIANISSNISSGLGSFVTINNKYLIISCFDGSIKEFDLEKRILIKNFEKQHLNSALGIKPIINKNGKIFLISYGSDKNMFLWDLE